jgi:hypothetical protein
MLQVQVLEYLYLWMYLFFRFFILLMVVVCRRYCRTEIRDTVPFKSSSNDSEAHRHGRKIDACGTIEEPGEGNSFCIFLCNISGIDSIREEENKNFLLGSVFALNVDALDIFVFPTLKQ